MVERLLIELGRIFCKHPVLRHNGVADVTSNTFIDLLEDEACCLDVK